MAFAVQAQDFLGAWSGKLDLRTAKLSLVFHFSKDDSGKLKCVMDSPDQGANGIPAEAEVTAEGKVRVTVSALGISYEAQVSDKRMEGTFNQGAVSLPLVLEPGEAKHNRPQTPTPPYMYPTEEVTFTNPADGAKLAGTLTYPMNFQFSKDVPVLVMVTGSGQQTATRSCLTTDHSWLSPISWPSRASPPCVTTIGEWAVPRAKWLTPPRSTSWAMPSRHWTTCAPRASLASVACWVTVRVAPSP